MTVCTTYMVHLCYKRVIRFNLPQIWSVFLQATDKIIGKITQNAQQMRTLLTTELQPLIRNKRSAGAAFDKDRLKAEDDYHLSCTEVDSLHQNYGKYARKSNKNKDLVKKAKPADLERYVHMCMCKSSV